MSRRRSGFFLIDLFVVMGIVGVLIGFLSAIRKAAQAANRAQCQNNLKQIGPAASRRFAQIDTRIWLGIISAVL